MSYSFGVDRQLVHLSHAAIGAWLLVMGKKMRDGAALAESSKQLLVALGVTVALYHAYLKLSGRTPQSYSLRLPGWLVAAAHVANGLMLVAIAGVGPVKLSTATKSMYLIIVGAAAALYHAYLQFVVDR